MKTKKTPITIESLLKKEELSYDEYIKLKKILSLYDNAKIKYETANTKGFILHDDNDKFKRTKAYIEYINPFLDDIHIYYK